MQWLSSTQLKSKEPRRRVDALRRLAAARDRQSISSVLSALGDPAAEVRLEALRLAVTWRDENTGRALLHAVRDPSPEIRERAIVDLGALGLRDGISAILPCLCDAAMPVRTAAVQALHMLGWMPANSGERALEAIGRSEFGKAAALGRDALELLLPFVSHAAAETRRNIASALGLIRESESIAALHQLVADADAGVRIAALTALATVEPTVSTIARGVNDPDKNVRIAAVELLGEMRNSEAVPILCHCLQDEHWGVRCAAAGALALLGERSTIPLLVQSLRDSDADVRVAAAEALGTIAAAESIEPLVAAYLDAETKVRQAALRALMRVDYRWHRNAQAYQTLPALKRALRSKDYAVRNAATELMERIFSIKRSSLRSQSGDPESDRRSHAADLLITCLWEDDALLRGAAAEALGALRSNRARDALKVIAKDSHQWIRQQAVHALDQIENSRPSRESGWRPGSGA